MAHEPSQLLQRCCGDCGAGNNRDDEDSEFGPVCCFFLHSVLAAENRPRTETRLPASFAVLLCRARARQSGGTIRVPVCCPGGKCRRESAGTSGDRGCQQARGLGSPGPVRMRGVGANNAAATAQASAGTRETRRPTDSEIGADPADSTPAGSFSAWT